MYYYRQFNQFPFNPFQGPGQFTGQGQLPGQFPGQGQGFPPGQFPGQGPGQFPGQGSAGGQQIGSPPSTPPPSITPQLAPPGGPSAFAVDPGGIRRCLFRFTFLRLTGSLRGFWYYPTFVGRRSVAGYRWNGFMWVYFGIDLNRIESFQCV